MHCETDIFVVLERLVQLQLNQGPCSCVLGDCGDKFFRFKTRNHLSQFIPHIYISAIQIAFLPVLACVLRLRMQGSLLGEVSRVVHG